MITPTQKYYKPISTDGFTPVRAEENVGPAISMQWIPIEKLFVDSRYQRPLNKGGKSNARQIAKNFKWRRFAIVIVTPIEGTDCYAIIDGQYKATGLLLRGLKTVPCAIVAAATVEEQADSFKFLNANVTRILQFDIYRAKLASGDEESKRLEALAERCGIQLVNATTARKNIQQGDCSSYKSFSTHARKYKEPVFVAAMTSLARNPTSQGYINSNMIGAYCQFFKINPGWMGSLAVSEVLNAIDLRDIASKATEKLFKEAIPQKVTIIALLREAVCEKLGIDPTQRAEATS